MMMKQITINGNNIHNIASFYAEINRVFMAEEQWQIGNSLDAFNDLLYGGFGAIKSDEKVQLIWNNMDKSKEVLGYEITKAYYEEKLKAGSTFNREYFREKLTTLEDGRGETYFDILMAIIAEHPNIELVV
ncbi:barstar family protein [Olivibacter domesticus]|uniref:Barstar (Barnase inhibitor) n=1 Tax=Olivibacter domesticus TaxID=407022 RepID=A0A1H7R4G7_OLID1|nr:barstar family protein [Olivibacter domesticus]SEL55029.1 Barstar (barnase inhibitor) [Olivibacter domesticus]